MREGGVELVDHGRVLDLLGPGELFGHASMLAELPTGFAARAHGATVCYCLPGDVTRPLLTRPEGMRYVARTLLGRPAAGSARAAEPAPERPVGGLLARRAGALRAGHADPHGGRADDRRPARPARSSTCRTAASGSSPITTCAPA